MGKITLLLLLLFSFDLLANDNFEEVQAQFKYYFNNQDFKKSELLKDEYLNLAKKKFDTISDDYAKVLHDVSELYQYLTEYDEAIKLYDQILNIYKNLNNEQEIANTYNNLCWLVNDSGRKDYEIAIDYCNRSISLQIKLHGENHERLVEPFHNLGRALSNQSKYLESIEYFQKALSLELNNQKRDLKLAGIYHNLAVSFSWLGKLYEAEKFYLKSLEIKEKIYDQNDIELAVTYSSLGVLYGHLKKFDLSEEYNLKGLEIRKNVFGTLHLETIRSQTNAAYLLSIQGNQQKCLQLLKEIIDPAIAKYGLYFFEIQNIYAALSLCEQRSDDFVEAEIYALQANKIAEKIFHPLDPLIGDSYNDLSEIYSFQEKYKLTLSYQLKAAKLDWERNLSNYVLADEFNSDIQTDDILDYIAKLVILKSWKPDEFSDVRYDDAFNLIQSISDIQASKALKKASLRIFKENDSLNEIIKTIQDLELHKKNTRQQILDNFLNNEDVELNKDLEEELISINEKINNQNSYLKEKHPDYFNLIQPHSSSIKEIQDLIDSNESLLSFFIDKRTNFIYLVYIANDLFDIKIIDYHYDELEEDINTIRSSLDAITLKDFDFQVSNKIYNKLIQPIESYIQDKEQLLIIPDKVLFKIPFSLLVRDEYQGEYKKAPWLINDYSIVNLPSINSLKYSHSKTISQSETLSYVGFGDPVLSNYANSSYRGIFNNIDDITKLESLPETKEELLRIAEILGKKNGKIYLGKDATETNFKELDFKNINLLLFATHGLISGELIGLEEPGLVMTPPPEASLMDNGILTASEILSFNFPSLDLVILSACNTSAGTSKNPEELSGLTRSFFYAGANSLLVSHWPVESNSAVQLTTNMFKYIHNNKTSKGYALQKSMKEFINNAEKDYLAHPIFWAPFMLVGGN